MIVLIYHHAITDGTIMVFAAMLRDFVRFSLQLRIKTFIQFSLNTGKRSERIVILVEALLKAIFSYELLEDLLKNPLRHSLAFLENFLNIRNS